jgi:hypothetical protein
MISKLCLIAAGLAFILSYVPLASGFLGGVLKPLAVIFFMIFFISNFLPDRELAQFEEDNRLRENLMREGSRPEEGKQERESYPHKDYAHAH